MSHTPIKSYGMHFAAASVARNYVHRPPYSPQVYDTLMSLLPPSSDAVLDAGCGPGKIALGLRERVGRIDAVDPSAEMLEVGRGLPGGDDPNICWIEAKIEDAPLAPPYGLIVCGVSFHWMDADVALTRFAQSLAPGGAFALVGGDAPANSAWWAEERAIYTDVIIRLQGKPPEFADAPLAKPLLENPRFRRNGVRVTEPFTIRQTIADYIACQHSRATFSYDFMGPELSAEFDGRLTAMLARHARDGVLEYAVQTRVEWGLPLAA
ncbi:MAG: class I SAM-dependent methyltransferase [Alphaproteobacteria bacterium]|nr:class I SAM-dependent methyltransferase [Alphaproteobacteria bacterium]MBV9542371.1 class I SAM-dependent methyltransferase [Alphaproteobacteria bacterium]